MPTKSKVSEAMEEGLQLEYAEPETQSKAKRDFDFSKYRVDGNPQIKTIQVDDDEFEVTVKPLSWSKKNQFLSKCLSWDSDGNTIFAGDLYVRECLKEILVDAPWGKTTEVFFISIDERLGNALEQLVPAAFGSEVAADAETLKGVS